MTEEDALQAGIRELPLDDLRRLVYADWLDERDRSAEAEYLRLVAALADAGTVIDPSNPPAVRLLEFAPTLSAEWRHRVGGRFDLLLDGYEHPRKIPVIKSALLATWFGLREAKELCEALPAQILLHEPFETCAAAIADFLPNTPQVRVVQSGDGPADPLRYAVHFSTSHVDPNGRRLTARQRRAAVEWLTKLVGAPAGAFDSDTRFTNGRVAGNYTRREIARLRCQLADELPGCGHPLSGPRIPQPADEMIWVRFRRDETGG